MKILANLIQGINSQGLAILENWLKPVPNLRLLPSQTVLAEEVVVRIVIYNLTAAALRLLEMSAICLGVLKNHDGLSVS